MKRQYIKSMGWNKSSSKKEEVYSDRGIYQEKISNTLILQLKEVEKEQTKPEVSRRKDIIRIRTKMNEIDNRKTIESNSKTKSWFFENINNVTNLYFS